MLSSLFEGVLLKAAFCLDESSVDFVQFLSSIVNFSNKVCVLILETLILVTLFRVEIIQLSFVSVLNFLDLLLIAVDFVLHIALFREETIQVRALLIILVFNMHEKSFDIIRFSITAMFIKGQVVIGKFSLKFTDILDK